jgi:N-6 DNA Methylase
MAAMGHQIANLHVFYSVQNQPTMKPISIQALLQANVLLPGHKRHRFGILICVLAFLKAWSDSCSAHAAQKQGYLSPKPEAATVVAHRLSLAAKTLFDTFVPADVGRMLTPNQAKALARNVDGAIARLVQANPTLRNVFQPGHFLLLQSVYAKAKDMPAPHPLVRLLATVSQVNFEHPAPSFACANDFACVMTVSAQKSNITDRAVAPLIAQLINPQACDVVMDMACGQGHLLLACADQLACTQPDAALQLIGMEKDHDQWALAKMLFSLAGLPDQGIQHHNALSRGYNELSAAEQNLTIGGIDRVVMVLPEKFTQWPCDLARNIQDPRFNVHLPSDGRLALFWLGLAAMKPNGGRMAVLVPMEAFSQSGGLGAGQICRGQELARRGNYLTRHQGLCFVHATHPKNAIAHRVYSNLIPDYQFRCSGRRCCAQCLAALPDRAHASLSGEN